MCGISLIPIFVYSCYLKYKELLEESLEEARYEGVQEACSFWDKDRSEARHPYHWRRRGVPLIKREP